MFFQLLQQRQVKGNRMSLEIDQNYFQVTQSGSDCDRVPPPWGVPPAILKVPLLMIDSKSCPDVTLKLTLAESTHIITFA